MRSAPPIITTSTNRIDWNSENDDGAMNSVSGAKKAPAIPPRTAERVKASVRVASGSKPTPPRPSSASRTARKARPQPLAAKRLYPSSERPATMTVVIASPRWLQSQPRTETGGMFITPLAPPVTLFHSMAPNSTMNANAIVTIAR